MPRFAVIPLLALLALSSTDNASGAEPKQISGVYPHLTMSNKEGECGTGAVVPWADRLWVITYGPHLPNGSSDKLYEITADLKMTVRPESVGGTPANRMIHKESGQLLIGPYLIDQKANVRVIPPNRMYGRLTGNARHLTDPASKVYYATMEEALYEVDVQTLDVVTRIRDGNIPTPKPGTTPKPGPSAENAAGLETQLPGYHGKGLYSGQGRVVYANNGDRNPLVVKDPTVASGALGEWTGSGDWKLVRRNQFTEVTGPGGIEGSAHPESDPIWSVGWDARSVILMLLDEGKWHPYRLPKASHAYDGAHGWNTEWPRIRDIGDDSLLMTMHGTFWRFPKTFSAKNSAGIAPRSTYLKVIGDFCQWQGQVVFGCDDSAKSEFLNKRGFKDHEGAPLQSHSNLWFVDSKQLDQLGPVIGRGSVWLRTDVDAAEVSDPYLFSGYTQRTLHITHTSDSPRDFLLETDASGTGTWTKLREVNVPPQTGLSLIFAPEDKATWIRLTSRAKSSGVTANFQYANPDMRSEQNAALFDGIATSKTANALGGTLRSLSADQLGLLMPDGALHVIDRHLNFSTSTNAANIKSVNACQPKRVEGITQDAASIIMTEDGKTYRLPRSPLYAGEQNPVRIAREVVTERDLLNLAGTFYELPARNALGIAKIRPVATHDLHIQDFCSAFGLMFLTGIDADKAGTNSHILRSPDGKALVWAGVIDDLWQLGKPRGTGGPWKDTPVAADAPSDAYLMTGYDQKHLTLSHTSKEPVQITIEVDIDGTGLWIAYRTFEVKPGEPLQHTFPVGFNAYWLRAKSAQATTATAQLDYK